MDACAEPPSHARRVNGCAHGHGRARRLAISAAHRAVATAPRGIAVSVGSIRAPVDRAKTVGRTRLQRSSKRPVFSKALSLFANGSVPAGRLAIATMGRRCLFAAGSLPVRVPQRAGVEVRGERFVRGVAFGSESVPRSSPAALSSFSWPHEHTAA